MYQNIVKNIENDLTCINASCTGISKQFKVWKDGSDFCQAGNLELQSFSIDEWSSDKLTEQSLLTIQS